MSSLSVLGDPGALAAALQAHARQTAVAKSQVRLAREMGPLPKGKPPIPDYRKAVLAVMGALPRSLKEISFYSGVRLPHARKTVEALARKGRVRNLEKSGRVGRWVRVEGADDASS